MHEGKLPWFSYQKIPLDLSCPLLLSVCHQSSVSSDPELSSHGHMCKVLVHKWVEELPAEVRFSVCMLPCIPKKSFVFLLPHLGSDEQNFPASGRIQHITTEKRTVGTQNFLWSQPLKKSGRSPCAHLLPCPPSISSSRVAINVERRERSSFSSLKDLTFAISTAQFNYGSIIYTQYFQ